MLVARGIVEGGLDHDVLSYESIRDLQDQVPMLAQTMLRVHWGNGKEKKSPC